MELIIEFFQFIFTPQSPIAVLVNFIIFTISAAILAWVVLQSYRIWHAYGKFKSFKKFFEGLDESEYNRDKIEELMEKPAYKHPWLKKKMETVKKLKDDTNATIDAIDNIDTNLRWITYGILRYPTGSLIVLGLLGTIAGLQKAIYSLLPAIQGGNELNLDAIKEVMVGTLLGMQTAFSTTLAGLFSSIVLGFFISLGIKGYLDRYITAVKTFMVETAIPLYSVIDEKQVKNLIEHTKDLKIAIKDLSRQSSTLFQPLVESADRISSGVNKMFEAAQTFVTASDSIKEFNKTLSASLGTLGTSLQQAMATMDKHNRIQTDIESTLKQVATIPQQVEGFIGKMNTSFQTHQENLQQHHEKMVGDLLAEMGKVMKKVEETATKLADVNTSLDTSMEKTIASQKSYAEQYLAAYQEQYKSIQTSLDAFLEQSRKDQDHRSKQVVDAIGSWVQYNQYLSELLSDMKKLPREIAQAVRGKNGAVSANTAIKEH